MLRRRIVLAARDTILEPFTLVHGQNLLAISLRDQGRLEEAAMVLREILADRESLDRIYPVGLDHALTGLGHIARADGRPNEAARHYREVLERRRRSLGAVHPEVANAIINLAGALGRIGQVDASPRLFDEGLEMRRVLLSRGAPAAPTYPRCRPPTHARGGTEAQP